MKKWLLLYLFVGFGYQVKCQSSAENLQKYWWYRYKLVNDFMKIGDECGESLIARKRRLDGWFIFPSGNKEPTSHDGNHLQYGDQTIGLGMYMGVLATEYRFLSNNSKDVNRTLMEIYYALKAFERLDIYAEERMRDFEATKDCANMTPHTGNTPADNDHNGFFIRDDVPLNFAVKNHEHFNRSGICHPITEVHNNVYYKITGCGSNADGHVVGMEDDSSPCDDTNLNTPQWAQDWSDLHPDAPQFPSEESQDQVHMIYEGLSLLVYYLDASENYNGVNLKELAQDNLINMCNYFGFTQNYVIKNPLDAQIKCVFGIFPEKYDKLCHCDAGGAFIFPSAPAIASLLLAGWKSMSRTREKNAEGVADMACVHVLPPLVDHQMLPPVAANNRLPLGEIASRLT